MHSRQQSMPSRRRRRSRTRDRSRSRNRSRSASKSRRRPAKEHRRRRSPPHKRSRSPSRRSRKYHNRRSRSRSSEIGRSRSQRSRQGHYNKDKVSEHNHDKGSIQDRSIVESNGSNIGEQEQHQNIDGLSEEEQMRLLMGFGGFGTTKGKQVEDNTVGAAKGAIAVAKKREYRQYMNRKGGFNRPLSPLQSSKS